jgi:hypothetical protein
VDATGPPSPAVDAVAEPSAAGGVVAVGVVVSLLLEGCSWTLALAASEGEPTGPFEAGSAVLCEGDALSAGGAVVVTWLGVRVRVLAPARCVRPVWSAVEGFRWSGGRPRLPAIVVCEARTFAPVDARLRAGRC